MLDEGSCIWHATVVCRRFYGFVKLFLQPPMLLLSRNHAASASDVPVRGELFMDSFVTVR